jgi:hypothetical protein
MKRIRNTVRYIDSSNKHFKGSQKTVGSITQLRSVFGWTPRSTAAKAGRTSKERDSIFESDD